MLAARLAIHRSAKGGVHRTPLFYCLAIKFKGDAIGDKPTVACVDLREQLGLYFRG